MRLDQLFEIEGWETYIEHGTKPGPSLYLTNVEETELANFLVDVPKAGRGKSRGINKIYSS